MLALARDLRQGLTCSLPQFTHQIIWKWARRANSPGSIPQRVGLGFLKWSTRQHF